MDDSRFDVEDFASNENFIKWVLDPDSDTDEYWRVFTLAHPELALKIDRARTLVSNLRRAEDLQHEQKRITSMWETIHGRVATAEPLMRTRSRPLQYFFRIAMSIVAITALCICYWYFKKPTHQDDLARYNDEAALHADLIEKVNETDRPQKITITDGSTIVLEQGGRLRFKTNYDGDNVREVYLLGEAFFEVAKNPLPFVVHANGVIAEVLLSRFSVQANRGEKNVVVSVKTGKASVYADDKQFTPDRKINSVILLPNQQVNYTRKLRSFERKLIEAPQVLFEVPSDDRFNFDNASVKDVFKSLQKAYGIAIVYNPKAVKNCYITGSLGSESLFGKLKIICETIGATYDVIDAEIVIKSKGC